MSGNHHTYTHIIPLRSRDHTHQAKIWEFPKVRGPEYGPRIVGLLSQRHSQKGCRSRRNSHMETTPKENSRAAGTGCTQGCTRSIVCHRGPRGRRSRPSLGSSTFRGLHAAVAVDYWGPCYGLCSWPDYLQRGSYMVPLEGFEVPFGLI